MFPQDLTMYLCKSYFSFNYGTFATEELVKAGVEAGLEKCCEMLRETEHFETRTLSNLLNNVAREVMGPARDWAHKTAHEIVGKLPLEENAKADLRYEIAIIISEHLYFDRVDTELTRLSGKLLLLKKRLMRL